ncbi:MAG: ABC transporter permease [Pseudomonadota bacterium]
MSGTATPHMPTINPQPADEPVVVEQSVDHVVIHVNGHMVSSFIAPFDTAFETVASRLSGLKRLTINGKSLSDIDTAGAWLIYRLGEKAKSAGVVVELAEMPRDATDLVDAIVVAVEGDEPASEPTSRSLGLVAGFGRVIISLADDMISALHILGAAVQGSQMKRGHRNSMSWAPIASQIDKMGIQAIPIIVLMSTIIGAILAQQGAFELAQFGAEIFVVDLVGILAVREIGVLLTAIMVAGRSGSAITAEIGSMKMREEVDALTVIGLNPIGVLVFPRIVALAIALPMLTVIANAAAMGGAMLICALFLDITPAAFIDRAHFAIEIKDVLAGLAKAPVMAMFIGIIASVEGMKVGGSAESLGRSVTASVVKVIFVVIVVDGLFAIFYAGAGI